MLRGQDHERGAGQRIRPGGERGDHQPVPRQRPGSCPAHAPPPTTGNMIIGALAAADPVPLLQLDRLRPVQVVQVGQQPVGVRGDPQHPLPQRPAVDREVADVAAPVGGDLLVGQHRAQARGPVHQFLRDVGQPPAVDHLPAGQLVELRPGLRARVVRAGRRSGAVRKLGHELADRAGALAGLVEPAVEELQEDPLGPAVEARVGGGELAPDVVADAQPQQLPAHVVDVVFRADRRVLAGADRVLLGREPERVVAERVQHVVAGHALEPAQHVGGDVAERVPDVQAGPARVREEVQDVGLRFPLGLLETVRQRPDRVRGLERSVSRPLSLPRDLDLVGQRGVVPERGLVVLAAAAHLRPPAESGK